MIRSPALARSGSAAIAADPPLRSSRYRCGSAAMIWRREALYGASRLLCRSWRCPNCRRRHVRRWERTLEHNDFVPRTFLTLTVDPATLEALCRCPACQDPRHPRPDSCLLLDYRTQQLLQAKRWRLFLQILRRTFGKDGYRYFRVVEFHKGNWDHTRRIHNRRTHFHVLLDVDIGGGFSPEACQIDPTLRPYEQRADLARVWALRAGFGTQSPGYSVEGTNAACRAYLTKYLGKQKPDAYDFRVRITSKSNSIRHPYQDPVDDAVLLWPNNSIRLAPFAYATQLWTAATSLGRFHIGRLVDEPPPLRELSGPYHYTAAIGPEQPQRPPGDYQQGNFLEPGPGVASVVARRRLILARLGHFASDRTDEETTRTWDFAQLRANPTNTKDLDQWNSASAPTRARTPRPPSDTSSSSPTASPWRPPCGPGGVARLVLGGPLFDTKTRSWT